MKIELDKKDYDEVFSKMKKLASKELKKEVENFILDFQNNLKLRKYLYALIREVVREELKYFDTSQFK